MDKQFEKEIFFSPAFDKRDSDPNKNYGIGAVKITFILKRHNKAVQFKCGTNWYPPGVPSFEGEKLQGWELGYHSPKPIQEWQKIDEPSFAKCGVIDGSCWYDGSTLNAEPITETLISEGSEGVWRALETYWNETFNEGDKE